MKPILVAANLSKWFGEVVAVNKLEVEIGSGVTGGEAPTAEDMHAAQAGRALLRSPDCQD